MSVARYMLKRNQNDENNQIVENKKGVARFCGTLEELIEGMTQNGGQDSFNIAELDPDDMAKGINSVTARSEAYIKFFSEFDYMSDNLSMENPRFRSMVENGRFIYWRDCILTMILGPVYGCRITTKRMSVEASKEYRLYPSYVQYARIHSDGDSVTAVYANGRLLGFLSNELLFMPVKKRDNRVVRSFTVDSLAEESRKELVTVLHNGLDTTRRKLILLRNVLLKSLGLDNTDVYLDVRMKLGSEADYAQGNKETAGILKTPERNVDTFKIPMLDTLTGAVVQKSRYSVDKKTEIDSCFGKKQKHPLRINTKTMEEEECTIEFLYPFGKKAAEEICENDLKITAAEAVYDQKAHSVIVRMQLKKNGEERAFFMEKSYEKEQIQIIRDFPHIVIENTAVTSDKRETAFGCDHLGNVVCSDFLKTRIYLHPVSASNMDPVYSEEDNRDAERPKIVQKPLFNRVSGRMVSAYVSEGQSEERIPEQYYYGGGEHSRERYRRVTAAELSPWLSFKAGENDEEIGFLPTDYQKKRIESSTDRKTAVICVDLGTANTVAAVKYDDQTECAQILDFNDLYPVTGFPVNDLNAIDRFYRLSLGYGSRHTSKLRTAMMQMEMESGAKDSHPVYMNPETIGVYVSEEHNPDSRSNLKTNIKFSGDPRLVMMYCKQMAETLASRCISLGVDTLEFRVSYPNEGLRQSTMDVWTRVLRYLADSKMIKKNGITIKPCNYSTEAWAVANAVLHESMMHVLPNTDVGFVTVDIGDGTTDISVFTPDASERRYKYKNQYSLRYATDDMLVDTIVALYAPDKLKKASHQFLFGANAMNKLEQLFMGDYQNDKGYKRLIDEAKTLLSEIKAEALFYKDADSRISEALRNVLVTLIEQYHVDWESMSDSFKALLEERFGILFYTIGKILKETHKNVTIDKNLPIYLFGGGTNAMLLLGDQDLNGSNAGRFYREMIARAIGCDSAYIRFDRMPGIDLKEAVVRGLALERHDALPAITGWQNVKQSKQNRKLGFDNVPDIPQDDSTIEHNTMDMLQTDSSSTEESPEPSLKDLMKEYMEQYLMYSDNAALSEKLIMTVAAATHFNERNFPMKDKTVPCYVSAEDSRADISNLIASADNYGNAKELSGTIRKAFQAARMVDQYLIKLSVR